MVPGAFATRSWTPLKGNTLSAGHALPVAVTAHWASGRAWTHSLSRPHGEGRGREKKKDDTRAKKNPVGRFPLPRGLFVATRLVPKDDGFQLSSQLPRTVFLHMLLHQGSNPFGGGPLIVEAVEHPAWQRHTISVAVRIGHCFCVFGHFTNLSLG